MSVVTPMSLVLGLVLSAPALWSAFQTPGADLTPALLRFVLASLLAGAGLAALRLLVTAYARAGTRAGVGPAHPAGATTVAEDGA